MNIPQTCKALGPELRAVVEEFWAAFRETNVHFFVETDRFCRFLKAKLDEGRISVKGVASILERESGLVAAALQESHTETLIAR